MKKSSFINRAFISLKVFMIFMKCYYNVYYFLKKRQLLLTGRVGHAYVGSRTDCRLHFAY